MLQEYHFKEKCQDDETWALKILLENPIILDSLLINDCFISSLLLTLSIFIFFLKIKIKLISVFF